VLRLCVLCVLCARLAWVGLCILLHITRSCRHGVPGVEAEESAGAPVPGVHEEWHAEYNL